MPTTRSKRDKEREALRRSAARSSDEAAERLTKHPLSGSAEPLADVSGILRKLYPRAAGATHAELERRAMATIETGLDALEDEMRAVVDGKDGYTGLRDKGSRIAAILKSVSEIQSRLVRQRVRAADQALTRDEVMAWVRDLEPAARRRFAADVQQAVAGGSVLA